MVRRCERPGCGQPADLGYGIDPDHLTVWIEPLDPERPERPGVLCRRHADSMVVPLRWTLDDRREAVPRLFRAPAEIEADARPKPSRSPRLRALGVQLALDDDAPTDTAAPPPPVEEAPVDEAPVDEAPVEEPVGEPWRPVFDPADDLGGLLDVSSPLLSRAFNGRERDRPTER
jgi:hypothetical protein